MSLPTLTGTGRLTEDPSLRFTPSGKAVAKVRLAFNSRRKNQQTQEWEDGDVFFVDGTAWERDAENIAESLTKGTEVIVSGRLKQRQYEKDGEKRYAIELLIDSIGPSLKFATAAVTKASREGSGGGSSRSSAPAASAWADDEPPF